MCVSVCVCVLFFFASLARPIFDAHIAHANTTTTLPSHLPFLCISDERTVIYPTLTKQAGYQVLVYNGEADLCVPYTDNEYWTRSMNYTVDSDWAAWAVNGEEGPYVGGYRTKYANNFTFATVRGAGHMVPETRAEAALTMFVNHITGADW